MRPAALHTEKEALRFAKIIRNAMAQLYSDSGMAPLSAFFLTLRSLKDQRILKTIEVESYTPTDPAISENFSRFEEQVREIAEASLAVGVLTTFASQVATREVSIIASFFRPPLYPVLAVVFEHLAFSPSKKLWIASISEERKIGRWLERSPSVLLAGPRASYLTYYS